MHLEVCYALFAALRFLQPLWANIFFGRGYDLENFQCINFFWIIENYGSPLLHQPCLAARDVCQRSWRDVTAIIAWIFVRDGDLDSIKPNVLPLHATVRTSHKPCFVLAV